MRGIEGCDCSSHGFGCNVVECVQHCGVDGASATQELPGYFLDVFDLVFGKRSGVVDFGVLDPLSTNWCGCFGRSTLLSRRSFVSEFFERCLNASGH